MNENTISNIIKMEYKDCPLAEDQDDLFLFKGSDQLRKLPGIFSVVKSKKSGLIRTNPRPTPETIGFYYPEDYSPYQGTKVIDKEKDIPKSWFRAKIINIFEFNTNRLPNQKPGRMLEIGCASGSFMLEMTKKGWEVEGIEFSEFAAKNAQKLGLKVHIGSLEEAPKPDKLYNLVVGWMVLEHLHEPVKALEKLHKWTTKDAWAVFSIPNAGSLEFKIFKDHWYATQLPTHLYHFTPQTISKVLEKAGWEVKAIYHQRIITNIFVSLGYKLENYKISYRLAQILKDFSNGKKRHYLLYPLSWVLASFGQTGRMTIWAKKKA